MICHRNKINTHVNLSHSFSTFSLLAPTEAVNLELININSNNNMKKPTATNGKHNNNDLPAKKDGDVEMGTATTKDDSYDEYFVPVNEHRKYMR
jgi:hypothetical protein